MFQPLGSETVKHGPETQQNQSLRVFHPLEHDETPSSLFHSLFHVMKQVKRRLRLVWLLHGDDRARDRAVYADALRQLVEGMREDVQNGGEASAPTAPSSRFNPITEKSLCARPREERQP